MENKKKLRFPLYLQILFGMIGGVLLGITALQFDGGTEFTGNWVYPLGKLFIRLLQLIAMPLIIVSLLKGIIGLKDVSRLSKMGGRAFVFYLIMAVLSVGIGISSGLLVKPGKLVDQSKIEHIREVYQTAAAEKELAADQSKQKGPLAFIDEIVPNNVFAAATENGKMLQVIFFVLFFGIVALAVPSEKIKPLLDLVDTLNDIILKMVNCIIRLAPYGVVALMAGIVVDYGGDTGIFSALGVYALTVTIALLFIMFIVYPLFILFFTKLSTKKFLKEMYPAQLFAFTTSSSSVTMPVTMNVVEKKLGVSKETTSFIIPIGTAINMDGTSCYQAIAVLFIAQVLGIDLSITQLLILLGMTILSSIGTPSIPGGSFVILSIVMTSVGVPAEGLALILGIDRPLDMLRTSVNITGDAALAVIIDKPSTNESSTLPHPN